MRLDIALVTWGLVPSRARAKDLIDRGLVTLDGEVLRKPNKKMSVDDRDLLVVQDFGWVSRSALKLVAALDHFDPENQLVPHQYCLDVGASTGVYASSIRPWRSARCRSGCWSRSTPPLACQTRG